MNITVCKIVSCSTFTDNLHQPRNVSINLYCAPEIYIHTCMLRTLIIFLWSKPFIDMHCDGFVLTWCLCVYRDVHHLLLSDNTAGRQERYLCYSQSRGCATPRPLKHHHLSRHTHTSLLSNATAHSSDPSRPTDTVAILSCRWSQALFEAPLGDHRFIRNTSARAAQHCAFTPVRREHAGVLFTAQRSTSITMQTRAAYKKKQSRLFLSCLKGLLSHFQ